MNTVLLQGRLSLEEIDQLLKEFPQYLFLSLSESASRNLSPEHWSRVEIFFGSKLTLEQLEAAHQLRWIHTPEDDTDKLCMDAIHKRGGIIVTNTEDQNIEQVGEFVTGALLAFAKHLFHWKDALSHPPLIWDSKWRESMWTMKNKILLQIGLGTVGAEITRRAKDLGMKVWGVDSRRTFHPYCDKNLTFKDLHSLLPYADVVSLALPQSKEYTQWFNEADMRLMKRDSVLITLGSNTVLDAEALAQVMAEDKLRGVLIDAYYRTPIPANSPLWKAPNVIITPQVAHRPKSEERQSFKTFRYNLRQYVHENFGDMRNMVTSATKGVSVV